MTKHREKTVAIYARVSTDKQKVDMQLNALRQFAARSGWRIHHEYIDQNFTGANTHRPAYLKMMEEARKRKFKLLDNGTKSYIVTHRESWWGEG